MPTENDPVAARDARRRARDELRGPRAERPEERTPSRHRRMPLAGPARRAITAAGIVAIGVAIAAIMGSQGSQGWLIGLVVSIVSLVLAAAFLSPRRS